MSDAPPPSRDHAPRHLDAAVAAADPVELVRAALAGPDLRSAVDRAARILVVGGGKAGTAMAAGVETALADRLDRVSGALNVPEGAVRSTRAVRLHAGRPDGVNHPTAAGVAGVRDMLDLVKGVGRATSASVCCPAAVPPCCRRRSRAWPWRTSSASPPCCTPAAPPSTR